MKISASCAGIVSRATGVIHAIAVVVLVRESSGIIRGRVYCI